MITQTGKRTGKHRGKKTAHARARTRGFSLIELVVALLLFGIGILGAARLELVTLREGHEALAALEAGVRASDLMARIRANPAGLAAGAYSRTNVAASVDCGTNACTPARLAAFDVAAACPRDASEAMPDCEQTATRLAAVTADPDSGRVRLEVRWGADADNAHLTLDSLAETPE